MKPYITKKIAKRPFGEVLELVTGELKKEQFGIITTIDVTATMKEKLNAEFRNYVILGACNPPFAHKALTINDKIGVLLPCNVIVQEWGDAIEVSAMDPRVMMAGETSHEMHQLADEVGQRLDDVIARIV